jgi:hypothetical protein
VADIRITANTDQAKRAIGDLNKALGGLQSQGLTAQKALIGITAAAAGVTYALAKVMNSTADMIDFARSIGISAGALDVLQQSAKLSGLGVEELNIGLKKMQQNIGEALIKGSGSASDALNRLGLSAQQLSTMRPDAQLVKISEAFKNIENPAVRAALAVDVFGKQGAKMLQAADDAARLAKEFEAMGLALSEIDYGNIAAADDAITELKSIVEKGLQKALAMIAPYIVAWVEWLKKAIENAGGFEQVMRNVGKAFKVAAEAAAALIAYLAVTKFLAIAAAIFEVVRGIRALVIAIVTGEAIITGGISAVATAVGVLAAGAAALKVNDMFNDLGVAADNVTQATNDTTGAVNNQVAAYSGLTDAVRTAIGASEQRMKALATEAQFNKDVLAYGKEEATIRKAIAEEQLKLRSSGVPEYLVAQSAQLVRQLMTENALIQGQIAFKQELTNLDNQRMLLSVKDAGDRKVITELERMRNEYGQTYFNAHRADLVTLANRKVALEAESSVMADIKKLQDEASLLLIKDTREREIRSALLSKEAEFGGKMSAELKEQYASQLKINQALKDRDSIQQALRAYNTPQVGVEAAVTVAGSMGQLDPVTQAITNQKTTNAGLEELRNQGLISEQAYQTARVSAAIQANDAIMAANRKVFETQKMYELQSQKNSIFGYETQQAIAKESADFQMKTDFEKAQWSIQQTASTFAALGAQNKKAFEASKALNIAMAIMNTYMGATKALATYPWPFGLIAAGLAIASGFAQVAQIRSQQYSGRAVGGPVVGGQSYMVGERGPELFTPGNSGNITKNSQLGSGAVTVNFSIIANDTTGFDELLTSRKGIIQTIISDAMLEKGQR